MATTCLALFIDFKGDNHDLPDVRMSLIGDGMSLQPGYQASKSKPVRQASWVTGQHTLVTWVTSCPSFDYPIG